jgi:hypothetical protein
VRITIDLFKLIEAIIVVVVIVASGGFWLFLKIRSKFRKKAGR